MLEIDGVGERAPACCDGGGGVIVRIEGVKLLGGVLCASRTSRG